MLFTHARSFVTSTPVRTRATMTTAPHRSRSSAVQSVLLLALLLVVGATLTAVGGTTADAKLPLRAADAQAPGAPTGATLGHGTGRRRSPTVCVTTAELQAAVKSAVAAADFGGVWDRDTGSVTHAPLNVDVSVISFGAAGDSCVPAYASVLSSRDWPRGIVVQPNATDWSIGGVDWRWWDYPRWGAPGTSGAWTAPPSGQWYGRLAPHLTDAAAPPYMVSHPASSFKLMLGVGAMRCVQEGHLRLTDRAAVDITVFPDGGSRMVWNSTLAGALEAMLQVSDNAATTAVIAALHTAPCSMLPDRLMGFLRGVGLHTLQLNGTRAGGYWGGVVSQRNRSSALDTTGFFEMTSWDAVRLMWLLDPAAPDELPSAWTGTGGSGEVAMHGDVGSGPVRRRVRRDDLLDATSRAYLFDILGGQAFHDCLSTTATCGRPLRRQGIPSQEPGKWIQPNGSVVVNDTGDVMVLTEDVRPCQQRAELAWSHKTGLTHTFGSAAGAAVTLPGQPAPRHFLIAAFGNFGSRYCDPAMAKLSPDPCQEFNVCYTQRVPELAARLDDLLARTTTKTSG